MYHTGQMYHIFIVLEKDHSCALNLLFIIHLKRGQLDPSQVKHLKGHRPRSLSLGRGPSPRTPRLLEYFLCLAVCPRFWSCPQGVPISVGKMSQSHSCEARSHFTIDRSHGENPQNQISEASIGMDIFKPIFKDFVRVFAPVTNHLVKPKERKDNQLILLFNLDFSLLRKCLNQEALCCKSQKLQRNLNSEEM